MKPIRPAVMMATMASVAMVMVIVGMMMRSGS
jgi:hypothetical protein